MGLAYARPSLEKETMSQCKQATRELILTNGFHNVVRSVIAYAKTRDEYYRDNGYDNTADQWNYVAQKIEQAIS